MTQQFVPEWAENFNRVVAAYRRDNAYYLLHQRQDSSLDLWQNFIQPQGVNMLVAFMQSALEAVGIVVSIGACYKAMQWATSRRSEMGYKTPQDAINDQETWVKAVEYGKEKDQG